MKWHVVTQVGAEDEFLPGIPDDEHHIVVPIDKPGAPLSLSIDNVWESIDRLALSPPQRAIDLLRVGATVFTADTRILRGSEAFDAWSREITLYIPVEDVALWDSVKTLLRDLLGYLTGDRWEVNFRNDSVERPPFRPIIRKKATQPESETACLFSGGLDSFTGAVNALAQGNSLVLVSHHGLDSSVHASPSQTTLAQALRSEFGDQNVTHLQFYISPPKKLTGDFEPTTRSRSIIFLVLGTLVASSLSGDPKLLVPENGLISINPPLTLSRLGSLSTRTTHPHTLHLFQLLLNKLEINVSIDNPFQFKTKGEMLRDSIRADIIKKLTPQTMSCSSPNKGRFKKKKPMHCGYCVPCLIRRAATNFASIPDAPYRVDIENADLSDAALGNVRAFWMAINRRGLTKTKEASNVELMQDLLSSGTLHATPEELSEYCGVYRRGLKEVANLLKNRG